MCATDVGYAGREHCSRGGGVGEAERSRNHCSVASHHFTCLSASSRHPVGHHSAPALAVRRTDEIHYVCNH
jgi:hypothetical protein